METQVYRFSEAQRYRKRYRQTALPLLALVGTLLHRAWHDPARLRFISSSLLLLLGGGCGWELYRMLFVNTQYEIELNDTGLRFRKNGEVQQDIRWATIVEIKVDKY